MSQPRHAKRGGAHRAVPPPPQAVTPPAPDDERAAGTRPLHAAPDPLRAPEPEEPAARPADGRPARKLTIWEEIELGVTGDPDFPPEAQNELLDEAFHAWRRWDAAIDREIE